MGASYTLEEGIAKLRLASDLPLGDEHSFWIWETSGNGPRVVDKSELHQLDRAVSIQLPVQTKPFGFALSFRGARMGSIVHCEPALISAVMHDSEKWSETTKWLRWWHAPVLHPGLRPFIEMKMRADPVTSCIAWLSDTTPSEAVERDEQKDDVWATALREFLWGWKPVGQTALDLLAGIDILTGDFTHDQECPGIDRLLRMSPILLAHSAEQAIPLLYPSHHSIVLRCMIERVIMLQPGQWPRNVEDTLDLACRHAAEQNGIDDRFIRRSLLVDAQHSYEGKLASPGNLRVALNYSHLRRIIAVALLTNIARRWEGI